MVAHNICYLLVLRRHVAALVVVVEIVDKSLLPGPFFRSLSLRLLLLPLLLRLEFRHALGLGLLLRLFARLRFLPGVFFSLRPLLCRLFFLLPLLCLLCLFLGRLLFCTLRRPCLCSANPTPSASHHKLSSHQQLSTKC